MILCKHKHGVRTMYQDILLTQYTWPLYKHVHVSAVYMQIISSA